mmetsp:Transcript_50596/g.152465  ORF Transcript_50596/g.152465 Transcript_50596/m.152465 type:complete len:292 (-) Transcript_50596:389-1264(-)
MPSDSPTTAWGASGTLWEPSPSRSASNVTASPLLTPTTCRRGADQTTADARLSSPSPRRSPSWDASTSPTARIPPAPCCCAARPLICAAQSSGTDPPRSLPPRSTWASPSARLLLPATAGSTRTLCGTASTSSIALAAVSTAGRRRWGATPPKSLRPSARSGRSTSSAVPSPARFRPSEKVCSTASRRSVLSTAPSPSPTTSWPRCIKSKASSIIPCTTTRRPSRSNAPGWEAADGAPLPRMTPLPPKCATANALPPCYAARDRSTRLLATSSQPCVVSAKCYGPPAPCSG